MWTLCTHTRPLADAQETSQAPSSPRAAWGVGPWGTLGAAQPFRAGLGTVSEAQ